MRVALPWFRRDLRVADVRRWIPEPARVPARWIHRPWDMTPIEARAAGGVIGTTYPNRIVLHEAQRAKALALHGAARADR
jgi:deoxyribodipyrimidine photo-lyase